MCHFLPLLFLINGGKHMVKIVPITIDEIKLAEDKELAKKRYLEWLKKQRKQERKE